MTVTLNRWMRRGLSCGFLTAGFLVLMHGAGCGVPPPAATPAPADGPGNVPAGDATDGVGDGAGDTAVEPSAVVFAEDLEPAMASLGYVEDELLVQTFPGAEPEDLDTAYAAAAVTPVESYPELDTVVVEVAPSELTGAAATLAGQPVIESVQKSYIYDAQRTPNDPRFTMQAYLEGIDLEEAWDVTTGDGDMIVAVLDSGAYADHDDLTTKLLVGRNVIDNNTDTDDGSGHGTSVCGVIGAANDNGKGMAGVSWACSVLPVMVTNSEGQATTRSIAKGLVWSVEHGAKVANVSFAPLQSDRTVLRAARFVRASGGLVFIASGNNGEEYDTRKQADALFVGAVNGSLQPASFSNTGPFVDLTAPGTGIMVTAVDGGYSGANGTSFASPIAAGVAALVWSVRPELRPVTVENILFDTATDKGGPGRDKEYGEGIVNAARAVRAALDVVEADDETAPRVSITQPEANQTVSGTIRVSATATDASDIADVVLSVDGKPAATDTAKPFRFSLNTAKMANGVHTLTCVATDAFGNVSKTASLTVFVAGGDDSRGGDSGVDTVAPDVVINFPTNGTTVTSAAGLQATVRDNKGLSKVEWLVDGSVRAAEQVSGVHTVVRFTWDAASASKGTHKISVRVTDKEGLTDSASISLIKP